ncbi:uncharacterized protein CLUP02_18379 [Colletotrichum lupini]|uniref:Uncharacterized protein n=1 Tax=Colletotrichum lupini TaxID=145971 RepID=A0A9Q8SGC1_9PEZI|nr:uncharacterized protein CLUP02_18379 [Colletotrichum lupini]UQC76864.1 hypothetical protein CLUP02_18379 [Colletotrichum lupini]
MGTYSLGWQSLHYRDSTAAGGNYLVTQLLANCFAISEHAQTSSSGHAYSKASRDANEQYTTPNSYEVSQQSPRASSQAPFIQSQSISALSLEQYMIPHPPKSQRKAGHGSQSEAVADSTVPIPTADQVTLLQEKIERLEDSETEKAQPLAIGYAHTESAPLTNGNHSQPAETLLSLSNKGIARGFIIDPQPPYTATIARRSNATSTVAFAFVPSFRIPRTVDASSPPMPTTATWDTGVVDAIELKMRQDLGKSDSWRRDKTSRITHSHRLQTFGRHSRPHLRAFQGGQSDALVNQVNKLLLETGLMGHRQIPETMTVKTMVPLSAEIVPTLKGSHPPGLSEHSHVRPKQQHPLRGEQHRAGDDSNDPIEPPPQETSAIYSAPAVSTWNAGLSPSPPLLISLSIPSSTPQFPDFLTSRFSSPLQLANPSASLVGNSTIVSGLSSLPPP